MCVEMLQVCGSVSLNQNTHFSTCEAAVKTVLALKPEKTSRGGDATCDKLVKQFTSNRAGQNYRLDATCSAIRGLEKTQIISRGL